VPSSEPYRGPDRRPPGSSPSSVPRGAALAAPKPVPITTTPRPPTETPGLACRALPTLSPREDSRVILPVSGHWEPTKIGPASSVRIRRKATGAEKRAMGSERPGRRGEIINPRVSRPCGPEATARHLVPPRNGRGRSDQRKGREVMAVPAALPSSSGLCGMAKRIMSGGCPTCIRLAVVPSTPTLVAPGFLPGSTVSCGYPVFEFPIR
jgi:hypothetical protein